MLPVTLDRDAAASLPSQLAARVRELVLAGVLARGDRLPSSRRLAADLGVSRAVTAAAFDQLLAEGFLEARRGSGTFVAAGALAPTPAAPRPRPAGAAPLLRLGTGTPAVDPALEPLRRRAWREVSAAREPADYPDPRGLAGLREALAERLARTRGLLVEPDEVVVTAGTADGLRHLLTVLPRRGVAIEDPGYRAAVAMATALGHPVRDLPAGRPVDDLAGAAAAYVTPAHQHPLGTVMPAEGRRRLLEAARAADALVLEDDFDSELRWDVAPVPALAAWDRDRVALLGTASKSVSPGLRIGWVVAPPAIREQVVALRRATHDVTPWPTQRAFTALLRDGYLDRALRSARRVYAERLRRVEEALAPWGGSTAPAAGMHACVPLPAAAVADARRSAAAAGFDVPSLADYCRGASMSGLVLGVGGCTDAQLDRALDALVAGLREHPHRHDPPGQTGEATPSGRASTPNPWGDHLV